MNQQEKVYKVLEELFLDAVLVSDGKNMRYISGFTGETGYVYVSKQHSVIFTDFRYTIQANQESQGFEVIEVDAGRDYVKFVNEYLLKDEVRSLGYEDEDLLCSSFRKLEEGLKAEKLVPVGGALTALRQIKNEYELECIEKAEAIGDIAFTKILDIIKPGMTELEIAAHLEFLLKMNGASGLSFDSIVASGINSSMPHATPSEKRIELGDFLTMDFGCIYKGYCSDMTRTIVVGKASDEQKKVYQTVLDAQLASFEHIHAGCIGKDVHKVASDIIDAAGYAGCFGHGLGHSVGLFIHEDPRFSPSENGIILENVIMTVEPGIYIKDFGGVRIEDLIVVKKDGYVNFTHSRKDLIEL